METNLNRKTYWMRWESNFTKGEVILHENASCPSIRGAWAMIGRRPEFTPISLAEARALERERAARLCKRCGQK